MDTMDTRPSFQTNRLEDSGDGDSNALGLSKPRRTPLGGANLALLFFMFIYFARPEDWIPGMTHAPLAKIAGILASLAFLFSLKSIHQRFPAEVVYLALLIGQLFLASVLSPVWRGGAFGATLDFAKVFVVIIVMIMVLDTPYRLRLLILTQAASVVAIAVVTLWKGQLLAGRLDGMLGGNYGDPNDLALTFVLSLPLCLALLFLAKSVIRKAGWAAAILLLTYAIVLTGSRGGFLSLIVTGAICLWQFAIRGRKPYLLVLAALLGVVVLVSTNGLLIGRLLGTFDIKKDAAASYASAQTRKELFWRSVEVTKEHPLFGVGPGNFMQVSGIWHVTHNSFTQISSEGGLPALFLYLAFLWSGFANIRATMRLANRPREATLLGKALLASLAGYIIGSVFLSVGFAFFPYFLVAYTSALFAIARKFNAQARKNMMARQTTNEKTVSANTSAPEASYLTWPGPVTGAP